MLKKVAPLTVRAARGLVIPTHLKNGDYMTKLPLTARNCNSYDLPLFTWQQSQELICLSMLGRRLHRLGHQPSMARTICELAGVE